ncbi:MAG TPA: GFA family protein [Burkholderiales bacterium]|jgi:hypothetical protein
MNYKGSCHCGGIKFEVDGDFREVTECNCSICSRKGSLLGFVPQEKLKMLTPNERMSTYTFNKHIIKHHFCPTCGIHPLAEAKDKSGKPTAAINVRCLEGIDLDSLKVKPFNGRAL